MIRTTCARRSKGWALSALLALALACGGPGGERDTGTASTEVPPPTGVQETNGSGPPVRGDWLVMHMLSDPEYLNPLTSNDAGASRVLSFIFPSLLRFDEATRQMAPLVARELPEISEDKLRYVFHLRDDVTFSDGRPLTAEDVVFAMKATKHPKVNAPHARNYYEKVRSVEATGTHTVRFEMSEPYFRNLYTLGSTSPIPQHYYDPEGLLDDISVADLNDYESLTGERLERADRFAKQFNENYNRNPMGHGAFVLEDAERDWITGERIVLRHRGTYWAEGQPKLGDGWVNRILFRIINDPEAALVAFKARELDFMGLRPIQHVKATGSAKFQRQAAKHIEVLGSFAYIGWNQKRKIFQDKRVRQALTMLVDKKNIIDKVLLGFGVPIESPIFIKRVEHNDALEPYPFDPAKARALLEEAGWADSDGDGFLDKEIDGERVPLEFEIMSNSGNEERRNIGLVVIDEFKKAGIDASFRGIDWSIMLQKVRSFDYDAVILGWTGGGALPPDAYQIWHSSQAIGGGSNFIDFKNEEVDRILEEYRVTFDAAKRKQLYDRFQEILYEEQPYTFLYTPNSISTWDRRFRGVTWYPGLGTDQNEWWVPAAQQLYQ